MRACLAASTDGNRFFERSFELDGLGTAAELLEWRDCWYLHGWTGECSLGGPPRLRDMAAVERLARHKVAPGTGERLAKVAAALLSQRLPVQSFELAEPLASLPQRWQQVFKLLPTVDSPPLTALAEVGSDLHFLQTALLAAQTGVVCAPAGVEQRRQLLLLQPPDGSVRWVRAETMLTGVQWLAHQTSRSAGKPGQVLIAVERQHSLLNAALASAGLPVVPGCNGSGYASRFKPALQLLHLALRLLQEPLDITVLMQFLTQPINSLPGYVCQRLTDRLSRTPGTGGAAWDALLLTLAKLSEPRVDGTPQVAASAALMPAADALANLRYWLESPRYPRLPGTPISALLERTERLATHGSLHSEPAQPVSGEASIFVAIRDAASHCAEALRMLQKQGLQHLSPALLDQLLNLALPAGSVQPDATVLPPGLPFAPSERLLRPALDTVVVRSPAAALEACAQVYWWQWMPLASAAPLRWSRDELSALALAGALLPSAHQQARTAALAAMRPVLLARECLTLVLPPEGQPLHPLWWTMRAALPHFGHHGR